MINTDLGLQNPDESSGITCVDAIRNGSVWTVGFIRPVGYVSLGDVIVPPDWMPNGSIVMVLCLNGFNREPVILTTVPKTAWTRQQFIAELTKSFPNRIAQIEEELGTKDIILAGYPAGWTLQEATQTWTQVIRFLYGAKVEHIAGSDFGEQK